MKQQIVFLILILLSQASHSQSRFYSADELYSLALKNSSGLQEKTAQENAASYKVQEMRSRAAPTLNFESTMSYISNPETLTVEAGALGTLDLSAMGGPTSPMPSEETIFEMSGNAYYDFKLILDQPLFTWGKIYNAVQATKEGAAVAMLDSMKMRDRLNTEIQINYRALHYLKEIELAASRQSEITNRLIYISEDSYENGMILQTEYLDVRIKGKEAELMSHKVGLQIEQVILNLSYLTGIELTPVMIKTENTEVSVPDSWRNIFDNTMDNNRDLAMMRHYIQGEEYKSKIQSGSYYFKPDLSFHMELSYSGSYFPLIQNGWNDENRGNMTLTVAIRSPVADFGGMYASVKASEEEVIAARASYESGKEEIEKHIRQTLYEMELNHLNLEYYRDRIDTDLLIIEQKEKEWKSGYGDERDYLMQQNSYYSNVILMNQELIELNKNSMKLKEISGTVNK